MIRKGWCWWAVVYQLVRSRARFLPGLPTTAVAPQVFRSPTTSGPFSLSSSKISCFSENILIWYRWLLIMILRLIIMAMSIFDCSLDHTATEGSILAKRLCNTNALKYLISTKNISVNLFQWLVKPRRQKTRIFYGHKLKTHFISSWRVLKMHTSCPFRGCQNKGLASCKWWSGGQQQ